MNSSAWKGAVAVLVLVLGSAAVASAQPQQGFGVLAGIAEYSNSTSLVVGSQTVGLTYESDGTSFGFDYQIPIGDSLSFNPMFLTSRESANFFEEAPLEQADVSNRFIGFQLRLWPTETFFLGGQFGQHRQRINFLQFNDEEGSGTGVGFALGSELPLSPKASLILAAQYDSVKMDVLRGAADTEMTGLRFHIGVRIGNGN